MGSHSSASRRARAFPSGVVARVALSTEPWHKSTSRCPANVLDLIGDAHMARASERVARGSWEGDAEVRKEVPLDEERTGWMVPRVCSSGERGGPGELAACRTALIGWHGIITLDNELDKELDVAERNTDGAARTVSGLGRLRTLLA